MLAVADDGRRRGIADALMQAVEEMARQRGLGGVILSTAPAMHGAHRLYERRGQEPPVSGLTGLWVLPGFLLLVLPVVWFVKTNGALNAYWRSLT